ncbi:hypothetical protein [Ferruginibacter sp.]
MKKLFLSTVIICLAVFAKAQQDFQGEIVYKLHASEEDKPDAELKAFFGNRKIKLLFKEKAEYDNDALLIILDSAATFTLNADHKTFKKKLLSIKTPMDAPQKRMIAGYTALPMIPENNGLGSLLGGMFGATNTVFYLADSLQYHIPDKFRGNMEFVIVQKNRIVLGAELQFSNPFSDGGAVDSSKAKIVTAEAISIKPGAIDESAFIIPADYVDSKTVNYDMPMVDTTAVLPAMADTAMPAPKPKKPVKKAPVKPAKSKTSATVKPVARKEH